MAFDVQEFVSEFDKSGGPLNTSHFVMSMTLPRAIGSTSVTDKRMSLLCQASQLPGIQINTDTSQPYGYGPVFKAPRDVSFTDLAVVFTADARGSVHHTLMSWLDYIVNFNSAQAAQIAKSGVPFFVRYRKDYAVDISVKAMNLRNETVIEYTLYDAYPTYVSPVSMRHADTSSFMNIPATFNFTRWTAKWDRLEASETGTSTSSSAFTNPNYLNTNPTISDLNTSVPNIQLDDDYQQAIDTSTTEDVSDLNTSIDNSDFEDISTTIPEITLGS